MQVVRDPAEGMAPNALSIWRLLYVEVAHGVVCPFYSEQYGDR